MMTSTQPNSAGMVVGPTQPIPVEDLRPGDHAVLLGTVVEIAAVREHRNFPGCRLVRLRTLPVGKPVQTLLPRSLILTGLHLPRQVTLHCRRCAAALAVTVDLVLGVPPAPCCRSCARAATPGVSTVRRRLGRRKDAA